MKRPLLLAGAPIEIDFMRDPHAWRGCLLSGPGKGRQVHAGSFLRQRRIVLDCALLRRPGELRRIFVHELFHFVWLRLSNPVRASWRALIAREVLQGARGELGWSAERLKSELRGDLDSPEFRCYTNEAFCDTAAWLFARNKRHSEFTLARRRQLARAAWFEANLLSRRMIRL